MPRFTRILRSETTGGLLMLGATVLALIWANSPWSASYRHLSGTHAAGLTLAEWSADGLLAIFFFVAGLELKRELVLGDLRDPRRAALPVAAAIGGMIVPALIFSAINAGGALRGWAIPTATDIAFALAVLAVIGKNLPPALRTFLLTLAVVDDLLAILIIAVFYASALTILPLLLTLFPLAGFGLAVQRRVRAWWILLPLAALTWALMHASGVHATVAGVLLAFTVPADLAERFEHRWRPLSSGVAVPVFAFFAAGVTVAGGLGSSLGDTVTIGVIAGLVAGKTIGIAGTTWLAQRFTRAGPAGWDLLGLALLGGIGFTVSMLIGELAYGPGTPGDQHAKLGVLLGSLLAAVLATIVLRLRDRHYRSLPTSKFF
ncbi:Na+/H+ antiporter NhaA [Paractinoplanes durhamensis]|uniref:Na(+)/H(+) antiporter NhaA n=1 Tax=Paractinoplanes durhamensis TaxID=113563 RepID=A0ABQ3ZBV3_9ACTN|nr:Na+/H+ antiporter NhaA [Actinoplanes durhamensis]GIE07266.1 Na(+)/H(+) antiporter NhaA [Actinoplanes durhamensis]